MAKSLQTLASELLDPSTGSALEVQSRRDAELALGEPLVSLRTNGHSHAAPIGPTDGVLATSDYKVCYPIVDGVPVLLQPEQLGVYARSREFDLSSPAYEEAYLEMEFYNQIGDSKAKNVLETRDFDLLGSLPSLKGTRFPGETLSYLEASFDLPAQRACYQALAPLEGKVLMQIGGSGRHVLKFLIAGAERGLLVTPMLGEALLATRLAEALELGGKFQAVVAVAEELPFRPGCMDGAYSGGCAHHFHMPLAMPEVYRVLREDGVFTAVEPFHAPMYSVGTRLFGKREPNAYCSPMTRSDLEPFYATFDIARVDHHGALVRYLCIALSKLGLRFSDQTMWQISSFDDRVADVLNIRRHGSSIALIGRRRTLSPVS